MGSSRSALRQESAASGVVFTGDLEGNLLAFDAASGKILFQKKAGGPIGGGIVTYAIHGKQYVAVAAGMEGPIMQTKSRPAAVVIYAATQQRRPIKRTIKIGRARAMLFESKAEFCSILRFAAS